MNIRKGYTALECERLRKSCNFTDDELAVFNGCTSGESRVSIAGKLHMSVATVDRRIRAIKHKIGKIM